MSEVFMRAKMYVNKVERGVGVDHTICNAVTSAPFDKDGISDDNTYAKYSPSGSLELSIANPVLLGKIEPGTKFYLDFTVAEDPKPAEKTA